MIVLDKKMAAVMLSEFPIFARNISFGTGFNNNIIQNISFVLKRNEFVGIIGGSGSGKTTLLHCLNGYKTPTKGAVSLNGNLLGEEKSFLTDLIGFVPQDDIIHTALTVERALYYSYLLRIKEAREKQAKEEVEEVLGLLELKEHRNKKVSQLSGGQRKRVSIGVELLHSPPVFFLDEPTAGLDPYLESQMMTLLSRLSDENRIVLMTTHLMQNFLLFDVVLFIHKGSLIYCGPSQRILEFFQAENMIECFKKVMTLSPHQWKIRYLQSEVYHQFLEPRFQIIQKGREGVIP